MGRPTSQGVLRHSLVAVAWLTTTPDPAAKRPALPLLSLLDQQFHVRQPAPEAKKAHPHGGSLPRQGRERESALWASSLRAVGNPPAGTRWVVVADRGADIYEHLQQCQAQGLGFVVRAAQDRALVTGLANTPAAASLSGPVLYPTSVRLRWPCGVAPATSSGGRVAGKS